MVWTPSHSFTIFILHVIDTPIVVMKQNYIKRRTPSVSKQIMHINKQQIKIISAKDARQQEMGTDKCT